MYSIRFRQQQIIEINFVQSVAKKEISDVIFRSLLLGILNLLLGKLLTIDNNDKYITFKRQAK